MPEFDVRIIVRCICTKKWPTVYGISTHCDWTARELQVRSVLYLRGLKLFPSQHEHLDMIVNCKIFLCGVLCSWPSYRTTVNASIIQKLFTRITTFSLLKNNLIHQAISVWFQCCNRPLVNRNNTCSHALDCHNE